MLLTSTEDFITNIEPLSVKSSIVIKSTVGLKGMDQIIATLSKLEWLVDSYVLDFYTEDTWSKLPRSWRSSLENLSDNQWSRILSVEEDAGMMLPLSLLALRQVVKVHSVKRTPITSDKLRADLNVPEAPRVGGVSEDPKLRVGIKEKKRHEIDKIIELFEVLSGLGVNTIVDIGAGLGHLSRILAVKFPNVEVRTIEGDQKLVETCLSIDAKLGSRVGSYNTPVREQRFILPSETSETLIDADHRKIAIVGLHPCGDLSSTILRMFLNYEDVYCAALFGCCYHKLNGGLDKRYIQRWENQAPPGEEVRCLQGFPLSSEMKEVSLSYAARELACHAIEQFASTLKNRPPESYLVHSYRALLEWLIVESSDGQEGVDIHHLPLKSVKRCYELPFIVYAERALQDWPEIWKRVNQFIHQSDKAKEKLGSLSIDAHRVFSFYCLRLLIASLVETLIIQDRMHFLRESGHSARSLPLFDPNQSPRNTVIVAWK